MSMWSTVPESSLPPAAEYLNTYRPDETECIEGHRFRSEADTVLPEGWDYFLCRLCVDSVGGLVRVQPTEGKVR